MTSRRLGRAARRATTASQTSGSVGRTIHRSPRSRNTAVYRTYESVWPPSQASFTSILERPAPWPSISTRTVWGNAAQTRQAKGMRVDTSVIEGPTLPPIRCSCRHRPRVVRPRGGASAQRGALGFGGLQPPGGGDPRARWRRGRRLRLGRVHRRSPHRQLPAPDVHPRHPARPPRWLGGPVLAHCPAGRHGRDHRSGLQVGPPGPAHSAATRPAPTSDTPSIRAMTGLPRSPISTPPRWAGTSQKQRPPTRPDRDGRPRERGDRHRATGRHTPGPERVRSGTLAPSLVL